MTIQSNIIPFELGDDDLNSITITGPDGQAITLVPLGDDESISDLTGGGQRFPRLAVTQNNEDERLYGAPGGTLFFTHSNWAIDEENGKGVRTKTAHAVGERIPEAFALGFREVRSWFKEKYNPKAENPQPSCASSNAKVPDPKYVESGEAPFPVCAARNAATGKIINCPMAAWSTDKNGDRVPPSCTFSVQIGFAAKIDGEWQVFDVFFRRSSENAGKQIAKNLKNVVIPRGMPSYTFPVELRGFKTEKVGRSILGIMSDNAADLTDEDILALEGFVKQWNDAQDATKVQVSNVTLFPNNRPAAAQIESGSAPETPAKAAFRQSLKKNTLVEKVGPTLVIDNPPDNQADDEPLI